MVFKTCLIQFSPIESKFLQDALLCKACKASKALNFDLYCLLGSGGHEMWKPGRMKKTSHWMVRRQAMSGHVLLWRCGLVHVIDLLHRNLNTSEQKLQGTVPNVQKHKLENQSFFHIFSIHFFINQPLSDPRLSDPSLVLPIQDGPVNVSSDLNSGTEMSIDIDRHDQTTSNTHVFCIMYF